MSRRANEWKKPVERFCRSLWPEWIAEAGDASFAQAKCRATGYIVEDYSRSKTHIRIAGMMAVSAQERGGVLANPWPKRHGHRITGVSRTSAQPDTVNRAD